MFSETSYHAWRCMAFKPNDQSYGHIHGIVCSNDLILCTSVHLGIPNNVVEGIFHFLCTENSFSIFRVLELSSFCEGPTIYLLQNWTKLFLTSFLRNELSCMKMHGFQAKWSILWPHSWHSLFKWSHIVHKGASWDGKQCCLRNFSFSLDKKFVFYFSSAQNEFFCEGPTIYLLQYWTKSFL